MNGIPTASRPIFTLKSSRLRAPNARDREPRVTPAPAGVFDAPLIAILDAPLAIGETARIGFARKEAELRAGFARLTVLEARALRARLSNARPGDILAGTFARLLRERQVRLLSFLGDARRREAIAAARR